MTKGRATTGTPNADPQLITFVELLFFAYRDFTREADAILAEFGLGRAHHRVLHFVNRHPGLRVADLLDILKITKQSLARVLKELVDEGWIVQMAGETDRRQRLLYATDKGAALSSRLDAMQTRRVAQALEAAGGNRDAGRPLPVCHDHQGGARTGRDAATWACRGCRLAAQVADPHRPRDGRMEQLPDNAAHILVVDDDQRIRDLLARYLFENGFRVSTATDAATARASMRGLSFDVVILDVMMPGETGLELARDLKSISNIPICMLTARAEPEQRIEGLEIGVDDYVAKPFEPRELLLRLQNILKRGRGPSGPRDEIRMGDFTFHVGRGELKRNEESIKLTERERDLLRMFAQRPSMPIARHELASDNSTGSERAIDVQINRLRRKIESDPANPVYLQTVRGKGYILHTRLSRTRGRPGGRARA